MSSYRLCTYLGEKKPPEHPFWEKNAAYTLKKLDKNLLYCDEQSTLADLLNDWITKDAFILNLGSGNPNKLINLLLEKKGRYFLLNVDISAKIIQEASNYCIETSFTLSGDTYTKNGLSVHNIQANMIDLVTMPEKAKIKNELRRDYRDILIIAHNCLHNVAEPGDEGLVSMEKLIRFLSFGDAFFLTLVDKEIFSERMAYYIRNVKNVERVQCRSVSFTEKAFVYGKKVEYFAEEMANQLRELESFNHDGIIVDLLTTKCQHSGFRTVLFTSDLAKKILKNLLPSFKLNIYGYGDKKPLSPVLLPIAGRKSAGERADTVK